MTAVISEDHIEQVLIEELLELGYSYVHGGVISPDGLLPERSFQEVVLKERLKAAIAKFNPTIPYEAQVEALKKVLRADSPELLMNNRTFHQYLTEGVEVEYRKNERIVGDKVWLVDYTIPEANEFTAINQLTIIEGNQNKRPDVILFVNGIPLVVIELKNASDEKANLQAAFNQLQTYKNSIPSLFQFNALLIVSDGWDALYGSLTAPKQFFLPWKSIDGKLVADPDIPQMEVMAKGLLKKAVLLDLIRHFTVFHSNKERLTKIIPRYHQYFAVNKAIECTLRAVQPYPNPSEREGNLNYRGGLKFVGLIKEARELRKKQTKAEEIFWQIVRNKKFLGLKFRRQHQIGSYIVDFYCSAFKLIIELDGAVHDDVERKKKDIKRDKYLTSIGNKVIRFRNEEIYNNLENVLLKIEKFIFPNDPNDNNDTNPPSTAGGRDGVGGNGRIGVIWHTQGSGKSLSMVFYAGKLVLELNNPTLVILTDRNDLDDQLFDTFSQSQELLRQTPVQAENREQLKKLLSVNSGGIVFTTIQKFLPEVEERLELEGGKTKNIRGQYEMLSDRRNIVVIADEAHRSQYDFMDGFAKHMRDALPNASFIGFTGTPIESTDKNTQAVFGDYIDIYDIQQAVEDGATVRIYYENRLAKINLKEEEKPRIDEEFEELTESEEQSAQQKLKSKWARLEAIVGHEHRLDLIAEDLVKHFESRSEILDGKAMVVCMSRRICVDLYNAITKIRPEWHHDEDDKGTLKVVMTGSSSDPLLFQPHVRNKQRRKELGERLKDPKDSLKIAIVRDMWLTGFDAPSMHTLYIDKPMRGHNLMQAIARVNRVYPGKEGGLIVDYIGIATDLKKALSTYTESGGKGTPAFDQEEAAAVMMEKYEIVAQLFNEKPNDTSILKGFNYKVSERSSPSIFSGKGFGSLPS